jgi:ABC-type thiamine transport system ATPase subunit
VLHDEVMDGVTADRAVHGGCQRQRVAVTVLLLRTKLTLLQSQFLALLSRAYNETMRNMDCSDQTQRSRELLRSSRLVGSFANTDIQPLRRTAVD